MEKFLILSILFVILVVGSNASDVCMEKCHQLQTPQGWVQKSRAESNTSITLTVAIKLRNLEVAEEMFWRVSDPFHESYGKYPTRKELFDLTKPDEDNQKVVINWINKYKYHHLDILSTEDYINIKISVKEAELMLSTKFYVYQHPNSPITMIRSPGPYYVPEEVSESIDFIGGVIRLPKIKTMKVKRISPQSLALRQSDTITPVSIKQWFNMPADIKGTQESTTQAVAQFDVYAQYLSPSDLKAFQQAYGLLDQQPVVDGFNEPTAPGIEAMLDIEYIMGVGQNITTWFVTTNGTADGGQEPFLTWITNQKNDPDSPWVHSISYGDTESTVSYDYADRVNKELMLLGLLGHTISFSSGDDGTGCNTNGDQFAPNFPASSPYVTSVGGITTTTSFKSSQQTSGSDFTGDEISSGGFSNYFPMPQYQYTAVQAYLYNGSVSNTLPPSTFYNSSSRAFPDISSFSENVVVYVDGGTMAVGGTSCASPVVSGIFSLLNDLRWSQGKSTLGFMNPTLYALLDKDPTAFFDITTGNNGAGCGSTGFSAAIGWDPITGVGAPNFQKLSKFLAGI